MNITLTAVKEVVEKHINELNTKEKELPDKYRNKLCGEWMQHHFTQGSEPDNVNPLEYFIRLGRVIKECAELNEMYLNHPGFKVTQDMALMERLNSMRGLGDIFESIRNVRSDEELVAELLDISRASYWQLKERLYKYSPYMEELSLIRSQKAEHEKVLKNLKGMSGKRALTYIESLGYDTKALYEGNGVVNALILAVDRNALWGTPTDNTETEEVQDEQA